MSNQGMRLELQAWECSQIPQDRYNPDLLLGFLLISGLGLDWTDPVLSYSAVTDLWMKS